MEYRAIELSARGTPVERGLHVKKVLRLLNQPSTREIHLLGKSGVGKTWMAREVCRSARLQGFSYRTLWFSPDDDLHGRRPAVGEDYQRKLLENVALQLSLYPSNEVADDDDPDDVPLRENLDKHDLRRMIQDRLVADKTFAASGKAEETPAVYLLVVLDGVAEDKLLEELKALLYFPKYLFTELCENEGSASTYQDIWDRAAGSHLYLMGGLSAQSSLKLLEERAEEDVCASSSFGTLRSAIEQASADLLLPPVIVMLADALNNVNRHTLYQEDHEQHAGDWTLDSAMEEAATTLRSGDMTRMMSLVNEMLLCSGTISLCSWHVRHLFAKPRAVHCSELIAHWLLEGYFDDLGNIQKAFKEGHRMLMALKDRGILKELQNDFVTMQGTGVATLDPRQHDFHVRARLGLADVMTEDSGWTGLGRITLADGLLKTSHKKNDEIRTLIVDGMGRHRWRQLSGECLDTMRNLRVLVILNPTFKSLPPSLLNLKDMQVLVLRGCAALVNIDKLGQLEKLLAVEISGAASLETIDDELFERMVLVRSVNLSGAGIIAVPYSLLRSAELRWLILRDCRQLESLGPLRRLEKLEVIDLSGSTNFERVHEKALPPLQNLHTLNFSRTSFDRLPFLRRNLGKLSRLLLSECPQYRLPTMTSFNALEILDLSGNKALKEIADGYLEENSGLRILNLSGSGIISIPEIANHLTHLLLKDCTAMRGLSLRYMKDLQVLNLSGATSLVKLEDGSFENLRDLRDLNLSGTKIAAVPKLCEGSKIRRLLLKDCEYLLVLQNLKNLVSLEVLDLSGCSSLDITGTSFRLMSILRVLNLSGTKLRFLPWDCFPSGLSQLIIRDCPDLELLPEIESMVGLEKLDLCGSRSLYNIKSETLGGMRNLRVLNLSDVPLRRLPPMSHLTKLTELSLGGYLHGVEKLGDLSALELLDLSRTRGVSLPPLTCFPNLRQLLLRDCWELQELAGLEVLKNLEVLDIAGTNIAFPLDVIKLTGLRKLHLQELTESDWKQIKHVPEDFDVQKCIRPNPSPTERISLTISGTAFFRLLKANADLWDSCFKKFHFSVWVPKEKTRRTSKGGTRNMALLEYDTGFLKDVDSIGRIPSGENYTRFLEIHGSFVREGEIEFSSRDYEIAFAGNDDEEPVAGLWHAKTKDAHFEALEEALTRAEHLSLIDDESIQRISQLGDENLKALESLWLESCPNISCIINRIEDAILGERLSSLYLYNLSSLNSICDDNTVYKSFTGLKKLHVECCPLPIVLFYLSSTSENLQVVHVKFCPDMMVIFDSSDESAECKLLELQLVELPKLIRIGVFMPFLRELKLRGCPDVEDLEEALQDAYNLETLHISDAAKLYSIWTGPQRPGSFQNLTDLKLESCPRLKYIFSSSLLPRRLKKVDIRHCGELMFLFNGSSPHGSLTDLKSIRLWNLPKLKGIGIEIPSDCSFKHWDCPNLPKTA